MKRPNLLVTHHNGSQNCIRPRILMPSLLLKAYSWIFKYTPTPRILYDVYFKAVLPVSTVIKKGDVYLDKSSGKRLIVISYYVFNKGRSISVQFCTQNSLIEKEKNCIKLPLFLKYLGNEYS